MSSQSPESFPPLPPPCNLFPFVAQVTEEELSLFAAFLARDFGFDRALAAAKHVNWYRGVVGSDTCGPNQAVLLRDLTMQECESPDHRHRLQLGRDVLRDFARSDVADDAEHRARRARLMAKLPRRVDTATGDGPGDRAALSERTYGITLDIAAAIDAEFDRKSREAFYAGLIVSAPKKPLVTPIRILVFVLLLIAAWAVTP